MSWWLDLSDLDDDQKDVIEVDAEEDHLILGPPGSGKTNLLLIRAEYLIRSGMPNVFVLMYNDALHDFVVRGGMHYDVPHTKIKKIMSWEMVLLREHGVNPDEIEEEELDDQRRALANRVLQLLKDIPGLVGHVQCLLVDEIQDCLPEEIEVFRTCAKTVCFAGDSRQRIFTAKSSIDALKAAMKTIELKTHYRIGHQICRVADAVGASSGLDPIYDNCNYKGPESSVTFIPCTDPEQQAAKIIESLKLQLTAYPDELLGIAAPRKVDRDFIRDKLMASDLANYLLAHRESGSLDPDQRIYISHATDIKGLEFRTIHLAFMEHISKLRENQKRIAYTAITRAKTTVSIYFSGKIPGYLEQARVAIEPPKPKPDLAGLFPKKKSKS